MKNVILYNSTIRIRRRSYESALHLKPMQKPQQTASNLYLRHKLNCLQNKRMRQAVNDSFPVPENFQSGNMIFSKAEYRSVIKFL